MIHNSIVDYMEALSTIIGADQRKLATANNLQPIHLRVINYLGRCNSYSDSHQTLCEFLGQSKGSVSTSVALLENKGLVTKAFDRDDKRKVHLKLSVSGKRIYSDQYQLLRKSMSHMNKLQCDHLLYSLDELLLALQHSNNLKTFGVCHSCKHLQRTSQGYECGLTQQPLSTTNLQQICAYHAISP